MKVVAIVGSPRLGNTYRVVQRVEQDLKARGDVDFEYVLLKDLNLGRCRGCAVCVTVGEDRCPLKDDLAAIEARMIEADGVILATPVYSLQVSTLMKAFIDRLSYRWHRPRYFKQQAMLIASSGGGGPAGSGTLKYLSMCASRWGMHSAAKLSVGTLSDLSPAALAKAEDSITRGAAALFKAMEETKAGKMPSPGIVDLFFFQIWRGNAQVFSPEGGPDREYWKSHGWFEKPYFYETRINPVYKGLVGAVMWLAGLAMRRQFRDVE